MNSSTALPAPRPLRVCMLAYTFYENDGRVMRYADALVQDGARVDAIVLRRGSQPVEEILRGVRVLRIQRRERNESGKWVYLLRVLRFLLVSMFEVTKQHLMRPYDVIHVHSIPDFEVFAAWVPKLLGAKLILDLHDLVPEFYAAKFKVGKDSSVMAALKAVERLSTGFADHVIVANDLWLAKITSRSVRPDECSAFINYPDLAVFDPELRTRGPDGKFVMIYPGSLSWHQGLDIAIRAFAAIKAQVPDMEFHIYGEGTAKELLCALVNELGLQDRVFLRDPIPLRQVAACIANADLGVVPKRNDDFGGEAFSTKILEFMASAVPVVVAATRIDTYYFDESVVRFFAAGDEQELAREILDAYHDRPKTKRIADSALQFARRTSWSNRKADYLTVVRNLVAIDKGH